MTSAAMVRVREIVEAATPGSSIPPIDCTNHCAAGLCDCSGEWRVMSWCIDIDGLQEALKDV